MILHTFSYAPSSCILILCIFLNVVTHERSVLNPSSIFPAFITIASSTSYFFSINVSLKESVIKYSPQNSPFKNKYIGVDLSEEYLAISQARIEFAEKYEEEQEIKVGDKVLQQMSFFDFLDETGEEKND